MIMLCHFGLPRSRLSVWTAHGGYQVRHGHKRYFARAFADAFALALAIDAADVGTPVARS